jgi:hypothetical protein
VCAKLKFFRWYLRGAKLWLLAAELPLLAATTVAVAVAVAVVEVEVEVEVEEEEGEEEDVLNCVTSSAAC